MNFNDIMKKEAKLKKKMNLRYYKDLEYGMTNFPIIPKSKESLGFDYDIKISNEFKPEGWSFKLTSESGCFSVMEIIAVLCKYTDLKITKE